MVHPSQPNYIDMIAGTHFGKLTDDNVEVSGPNVADLLEAKGLTWKSYQENYPGNCNATYGTNDHLYMRKHNPFMSFASIRDDPNRCANIVDEKQFLDDVANGDLPNYIFYTPNQIHDGHGTPPYAKTEHERILEGSLWLSTFIPKLLSNPVFKDTLFVITFDENDVTSDAESISQGSDKPGSLIRKENLIYTVLLGAGVQVGSVDNTRYDHHSGIALLEREWDLGSLGTGDVNATPFRLSDADHISNGLISSDSYSAGSPSNYSAVPPPCTTTANANSVVPQALVPQSYATPVNSYYYTTAAPISTTYPAIYQSSAIQSTVAPLVIIGFCFLAL